MGKIILCSSIRSQQPFYFTLTNTCVYSIDELCYYLYHNIYSITEDIFDENLVEWLENDLKMEALAKKMKSLIDNHKSLKDFVVTLLCSADYFGESEIKSLITIIDEIGNMTPFERNKLKADNQLKYRNFSKAIECYEELLKDKSATDLGAVEYGNILHNLAIALLQSNSYVEASYQFKEAYCRNHNKDSLMQYLYSLKLAKKDELMLQEIIAYELPESTVDTINQLVATKELEAQQLPIYEEIDQLQQMKEDGKVSEYYRRLDELLYEWKKIYRREIV